MADSGFTMAEALPRHVAVIMDGNGRWARQRGLPRIEGHRQGATSVREIVRTCRELGVRALTLFAFSEQNWERPGDEVEALMELLHQYVLEEQGEILETGIRLAAIGDLARLPTLVRHALRGLIEVSAKNQTMTLCLALSYSSQRDMITAVREIAADVQQGRLSLEAIDLALFSRRLATARLPPLDLLIRTSGEYRLSDFLLWEAAFTELFFTPMMWPEFRKEHLLQAIAAYQARERRFGRTSEQLPRDAKA